MSCLNHNQTQVCWILNIKMCCYEHTMVSSKDPDVKNSFSHTEQKGKEVVGGGGVFFLDCFGVGARQQLTPAVGSLGWVCSGISKLAEAQGPPQRSDVTNSSRECFTFLFLAVVRSFPAIRGKNTEGLFSGEFGSREWREPKDWDWKHMVVWEYLWL